MLSFSFIVSLEKNHFFFMGSDPAVLSLGSDPEYYLFFSTGLFSV